MNVLNFQTGILYHPIAIVDDFLRIELPTYDGAGQARLHAYILQGLADPPLSADLEEPLKGDHARNSDHQRKRDPPCAHLPEPTEDLFRFEDQLADHVCRDLLLLVQKGIVESFPIDLDVAVRVTRHTNMGQAVIHLR